MAGLDVKVFSETDAPNGLHPSRMCAAKSNKNNCAQNLRLVKSESWDNNRGLYSCGALGNATTVM